MSSPNEPGSPRHSDGPGTNGLSGQADGTTRPGPVSTGEHSADVPPWQRGGAGRTRPPQRGEGPSDVGRTAAAHSPGADAARLNRFMSGGSSSTPTRDSDSVPPRGEGPRGEAPRSEPPRAPEQPRSEPPRPEAYASEIPDLSGPPLRPVTRKAAAERSGSESSPRSATRTSVASRQQGPVRASMQIRRFDPWSVLKVSLVLSVALFFVWMIAVAFLYVVLGGMGVWSKLNSNVGDLLTSASGSGGELVSSGTIFGGAALIGLVNIVLLTAMATCAAFIYNLTTDLVGGVEVTLADRD